jgi:hypothetical protein
MPSSSRIARMASIPLIWFLISSSAGACLAQIVECTPKIGGFSVFLSRPANWQNVFKNETQLTDFLEELQFRLDQKEDGAWVNAPGASVQFVICYNRSPKLDNDDDFAPTIIENMHNKRVLLEIWGKLNEESAGGDGKITAQMNYLLVPVKFAVNRQEMKVNALQRLLYSDDAKASADSFANLISGARDIDAFVAAAFGFKLLREHDYILAHSNLCHASGLLREASKRTTLARARQNIDALRQEVNQSASRAISEAKKDPKFAASILSIQNPNEPCAGEE